MVESKWLERLRLRDTRARAVRNVLGNLYLRLRVPAYHAITGAIFMQAMLNSYSA